MTQLVSIPSSLALAVDVLVRDPCGLCFQEYATSGRQVQNPFLIPTHSQPYFLIMWGRPSAVSRHCLPSSFLFPFSFVLFPSSLHRRRSSVGMRKTLLPYQQFLCRPQREPFLFVYCFLLPLLVLFIFIYLFICLLSAVSLSPVVLLF